jgi:hypothetical protein
MSSIRPFAPWWLHKPAIGADRSWSAQRPMSSASHTTSATASADTPPPTRTTCGHSAQPRRSHHSAVQRRVHAGNPRKDRNADGGRQPSMTASSGSTGPPRRGYSVARGRPWLGHEASVKRHEATIGPSPGKSLRGPPLARTAGAAKRRRGRRVRQAGGSARISALSRCAPPVRR